MKRDIFLLTGLFSFACAFAEKVDNKKFNTIVVTEGNNSAKPMSILLIKNPFAEIVPTKVKLLIRNDPHEMVHPQGVKKFNIDFEKLKNSHPGFEFDEFDEEEFHKQKTKTLYKNLNLYDEFGLDKQFK